MIRPSSHSSTGPPRHAPLLVAVLALLLPVAACAGSGGSSPVAASMGRRGAPTPEQAVHGFLGALRADDYPAMARYFGTTSGPAEEKWGVEEVEQRMLVLAGVMEHQTAELRPARRSVTDRERREFVLSLEGTRYGAVTLPVMVARAGSGRWFVERIDTSGLNP